MALYLGKKKLTPIKVVDLPDDLDKELTEQEILLAEVEEQINELDEVSGELEINKNGQYNVKNYESVKVDVGAGKELVIDLPENFKYATSVLHFVFDDNTILFTSNKNSYGVWRYKISENSWKQIYSSGYYGTFVKIGHTCLISAINSGATAGIIIYNSKDDTGSNPYTKNYAWSIVKEIGGHYFIYGSTYNSGGVLLYDLENLTFTELITTGNNYSLYHLVGDKVLISSTSSSYNGIYRVNLSDYSTNKIFADGYNYYYGVVVGNTGILCGSNSAAGRILRYDADTDSIKEVIQGYWYNPFVIEDRVLFSTKDSSDYKGVLIYDITLDTTDNIYTTGQSWYFRFRFGNKVFMGSTNGAGVLIYDYDTNTITQGYTQSTYWTVFVPVGENLLILNQGIAYGILKYTNATNALTKIYSTGVYSNAYVFKDKCFLTSNSNNSMIMYDLTKESISTVTINNYGIGLPKFNTFTPDGDDLYIESSDKKTNSCILKYSSDTGQFRIAKYYIGVI